MVIRLASSQDAAACLAIYAPFVRDTACTFEETPPKVRDFAARIDTVLERHAWLVAEEGGQVIGYAYASNFRERTAYRWVCESSIYLAPEARGRGLGRRLYLSLLALLRAQGFLRVYAVATLPNPASVHLHEGMGFRRLAELPAAGYKAGTWHSIGIWELPLAEANPAPSEPRPLSAFAPVEIAALLEDAAGSFPANAARRPLGPLRSGSGYCLVLSGGGAKGVYHVGAWRALRELGLEIDAVVGNSIGAIVAGFLAQGLETELEAICDRIGIDYILKLPPELVADGELKLGLEALPRLRALAQEALERRGLDTGPLRQLLGERLDEAAIRAGGMDLGIVTFNLSEMKPREVFIDAMEVGHLIDYLMASAAIPGFKSPEIAGQSYIDGGVYDNIPYEAARRRGYRRLIVIDISGAGRNRRPDIASSETVYIRNSLDMGGVLDFDRGFLQAYRRLGYLDTLRAFGRLWGYAYFVEPDRGLEARIREILEARDDCAELLDPEGAIYPETMRYDPRLGLKLLECAAGMLEVERVERYTMADLARRIEARRLEEDARLAAMGVGSKNPNLLTRAREAIGKARLDACPYHYAILIARFARGRSRALLERLLFALVPGLRVGLRYLDLANALGLERSEPGDSLEGGAGSHLALGGNRP